jgi:hypothetical protein
MQKKGLCDTCEYDKRCVLRSRFPVLQCEEFIISNHKITTAKTLKQKRGKYCEEITVEE